MKKYIVIAIILLITFAICFGIGMYIFKIKQINNTDSTKIAKDYEEKVTDDCVNEAYEIAIMQTNSTEEKISPNSILILKKVYKECGHVIKDYIQTPEELVNKSREEIKENYKEWEIESFSPNEIILKKEEEGICNEHYLIKEEEGEVVVYSIDKEGKHILKEKTGIISMYLPEMDFVELKNGVRVNGRDSLNKILEDFE